MKDYESSDELAINIMSLKGRGATNKVSTWLVLFYSIALLGSLGNALVSSPKQKRTAAAQELLRSLIDDEKCFTTESGALRFGEVCATDIVYEDCYEPQPLVGRTAVTNHMIAKVAQRQGKGGFRANKISDGTAACGFTWTWTCGDEDGLRGTTFVELNSNGEIQYVREIPEPIFKPGELTKQLLEAITKDSTPKEPKIFEQRTPTTASEVAEYLYLDVQGSSADEAMRFFDDNVVYYDFNYDTPFRGTAQVRKFIEDFSFPGIEFRAQRFDDGIDSTCFTWEVCLEGADSTVKGISFYELSPQTKKISYVCDIPESAIKPPILGKLARQLRPGLGVFKPHQG